jgi:tRNA(Ile)-lysidine synthase
MDFSADVLRAVLDHHLPAGATGVLAAVSGGGDSACLLAALRDGGTPRGLAVRAVHVDHGLQPASATLRRASESLCSRLGIPLEMLTVDVDTSPGRSIEAEARAARYGAIERALAPGECLLTAHHAEDQAETLLLQLLRGAGLKGLSGMPMCRVFGRGWHVRPLLDVTRAALREFGAAREVVGIDDPMNDDRRFDRSYLRQEVWPSIERRWPGAASALARSAQHLAAAQTFLDAAAARTVDRLRDGDALSVPGLRALPPREQVNVLRFWIASAAIVPPSTARLGEAMRQIFTANADHLPAVVWGEHALRRYQERLFVTPAALPALAAGEALAWRVAPDMPLELGAGLGVLRWVRRAGGLDEARLPETLSVRGRRGGETLKPAARARTQTVQHLCQALGVLPWMRDALPMIHAGDALVAVGDLWRDARYCVPAGATGLVCTWENAPPLT